ncbi:hypothetical protein TIFTF001_033034 [Ficus carica]|uniref:Uncharacterized protein n=1 Tax=Ficus carica TaxID=3494 RepID=A0AA88J763_FICCA|nr:hypothetical protein TIFTF001_033034 [Ficus carica]
MMADQGRKQQLGEMIFEFRNSGKCYWSRYSQGIEYIQFQNPEHRGWTKTDDQRPKQHMRKRKEHIYRRNCKWARVGRIVNRATVKQQMGEEGGRSRAVGAQCSFNVRQKAWVGRTVNRVWFTMQRSNT